ncbi:MAG TPA: HEAT repeat domain-containing protein, partial [Phycisphaerae bacterium]|nr:HEAT repeat domain-containing protein [Phycisphaerae bacterium]
VVETVPLLAKAVSDKVEEVQFQAVRSLAVLPYPEVIPLLKQAADSPYASVKRAAQVELERREKH